MSVSLPRNERRHCFGEVVAVFAVVQKEHGSGFYNYMVSFFINEEPFRNVLPLSTLTLKTLTNCMVFT